MKLNFSRFLIEYLDNPPNISSIKNNLRECVGKRKFIYRGSETGANFGEKEERKSRKSLTGSNLFLNFTPLYFEHLPSRSKSYFATNSAMVAMDFGKVFVIIPHDTVEKCAMVKNDFNLNDNKILNKIENGMNFSEFGNSFVYSLVNICAFILNKKTSGIDHQVEKVKSLAFKISEDNVYSKSDFELFDNLLNEMFTNADVQKLISTMPKSENSYSHIRTAAYVWEIISADYDGSFILFLKDVVRQTADDTKVLPFSEILDELKYNEFYEVWFEGKCSVFSLDWIREQLAKDRNNEDFSFSDEARNEEDFDALIAECLIKFVE